MIFILVLLFVPTLRGGAQGTIADIKKKQEQIAREINKSKKLLEITERRRKNTVNQIYILNEQIKNREKLIHEYEKEIELIGKKIVRTRETIDSIEKRSEVLKKEYSWIIKKYYEIYKENKGIVAYIFASDNLNQAYKRLKYYEQFLQYGRKLYNELEENRNMKEKEINILEQNRQERERVLKELKKEQNNLVREKRKKNVYVYNLQKKEKELQKDIRKKRKIAQRLSDEIKKIIAEERKKNKKSGLELTPEEKIIAGNFSKNFGKLPWPTRKGIIVDNFGVHQHPVLKNVTVRNDGIDIMTENGEKARAVFEGEVRKIIAIPGANETVIIKHGNYYTVYQNIYNVSVKTGQHVNIKEPLGTVFTDQKTGETVLHFEIWEGLKKLNPEKWLAGKK